jgi:hypothetical protein
MGPGDFRRDPDNDRSNATRGKYSKRVHQNVVIGALANKLVRMAWAVLCKNESYRAPALAVSA